MKNIGTNVEQPSTIAPTVEDENAMPDSVEELRKRGYAVAIFTPEELAGVRVSNVEDRMVAAGWDIIAYFADDGDNLEPAE